MSKVDQSSSNDSKLRWRTREYRPHSDSWRPLISIYYEFITFIEPSQAKEHVKIDSPAKLQDCGTKSWEMSDSWKPLKLDRIAGLDVLFLSRGFSRSTYVLHELCLAAIFMNIVYLFQIGLS